eukprot:scaffold36440_cov41-Phaeocystis_antarctica.AAC.3
MEPYKQYMYDDLRSVPLLVRVVNYGTSSTDSASRRSVFPPLSNLARPCDRAAEVGHGDSCPRWGSLPLGTAHVRTLHARSRPPRGRARAARDRARPRLQAAARQASGAAARPGSGHQGGPRGADGAEGRERGCQGHLCAARCQ